MFDLPPLWSAIAGALLAITFAVFAGWVGEPVAAGGLVLAGTACGAAAGAGLSALAAGRNLQPAEGISEGQAGLPPVPDRQVETALACDAPHPLVPFTERVRPQHPAPPGRSAHDR